MITSHSASDSVIGAMPEGPARHFCSAPVTQSICHSSTGSGVPHSDAVASTCSITPWRRHRAPSSDSGCSIVVDVSPWQQASSFGENARISASISARSNTVPHSASITRTCAPTRRAISAFNWPNRPKLATSTRSPGSTSDSITVSIAERAVPSMHNVCAFDVSNTPR